MDLKRTLKHFTVKQLRLKVLSPDGARPYLTPRLISLFDPSDRSKPSNSFNIIDRYRFLPCKLLSRHWYNKTIFIIVYSTICSQELIVLILYVLGNKGSIKRKNTFLVCIFNGSLMILLKNVYF